MVKTASTMMPLGTQVRVRQLSASPPRRLGVLMECCSCGLLLLPELFPAVVGSDEP